MKSYTCHTVFNPEKKDLDIILDGLHSYNVSMIGEYEPIKVAVFAKDEEEVVIGGVFGTINWGWLFIEWFWVKANKRQKGIGSRLLKDIEKAANQKDVYHYYLGTSDFQALPFYQKNGYEIFSKLDDSPPGHSLYFLKKESVNSNQGVKQGF